jgi:rubrerythrin
MSGSDEPYRKGEIMTAHVSTDHPLTELAGSEWDENLLAHFQEHVEGERELLEAYAKFRHQGPEYVRYLIDLILADEARHHQMFRELVNRVRSDIDWRDYGPKVPYLSNVREEAAALVAATDRLLAFEREDEKSLRRLRKELRPVRDTTLFSLLVELMELDTKKHIAILEFIHRKAAERS